MVLVGLPARGKSYIATKLSRYLNWVGINTKGIFILILMLVFNVGSYRRRQMQIYNGHDYFSDDNEEAVKERKYCSF